MKSVLKLAPIAAGLALVANPAMAQTATYAPIITAEVELAQRAWCGALVASAAEADTKGQPAAKALPYAAK
jgi:hypothetical protein